MEMQIPPLRYGMTSKKAERQAKKSGMTGREERNDKREQGAGSLRE
jgi:hypothetical protein